MDTNDWCIRKDLAFNAIDMLSHDDIEATWTKTILLSTSPHISKLNCWARLMQVTIFFSVCLFIKYCVVLCVFVSRITPFASLGNARDAKQ